jgi:HAE1 family hydrophobic/amphiphilic exporter-1
MSIVIVMLGLVAMQGLPIAQYPEIVPPMVQVTTTFIGASATDVEASVATPLETEDQRRRKRHLHEVDQRQRRDADAQGLVRGRVEPGHGQRVHAEPRVRAMPQMPQSVKNYGVTVKKALAFPLLVLSIKSPNGTYDSSFLSNYTTININDAHRAHSRRRQINLFGGSDYAMRIWLRPDRHRPARVTIPDIANAIPAEPADPGRPDRRPPATRAPSSPTPFAPRVAS